MFWFYDGKCVKVVYGHIYEWSIELDDNMTLWKNYEYNFN